MFRLLNSSPNHSPQKPKANKRPLLFTPRTILNEPKRVKGAITHSVYRIADSPKSQVVAVYVGGTDGSNRPATFKAALLYRFREIGVKLSVEDSDCAKPSSISWLERGVRNSVVVHDGKGSAWPLTVVGGPTVMPGSAGTVFLPHLEDTDGANPAPPAWIVSKGKVHKISFERAIRKAMMDTIQNATYTTRPFAD